MTSLRTVLVTKEIDDTMSAIRVCGEHDATQFERRVAVTVIPKNSGCAFYIAIPEGFHTMVSSFGKFLDIWQPGFHCVYPWVQVSAMVTKQYIVYDTPVKQCPTLDNVMVEIDVSVVFHIKDNEQDVFNFHYNMGPQKLDEMLMAFQQETVRSMARQKQYSNIYDLMDTEELKVPMAAEDDGEAGQIEAEAVLMPGQIAGQQSFQMTPLNAKSEDDVNEQLENTKRSMNEKLGPHGVQIYSITITNIVLPIDFRNQMESATTFDSKNRCAAAEQEYNLLVIKDTEKRAQTEQRLKEELMEMQSKNQQRLAQEAKLTALYVAGTEALVADIREKMNSDLRIVRTDSELKVAKLEKERDLELAEINAQTSAEVVRINTEIDAFIAQEKAHASAVIAAAEAETLKLMSDAEAQAATKLVSRRDFEAKMAQLRIIQNIAHNEQISISGTNKDSVVAQIVASKNASIALGLNE